MGRDRGGRMSDMGPDKTDTDWRARPSGDSDDSHHRKDDAFGESEAFNIKLELRITLDKLIFTYMHKNSHLCDGIKKLSS